MTRPNTDLTLWKDMSRSPPHGPAANNGRNDHRNDGDWDRGSRQYDRGYTHRDRSSPSPRRGRGWYRDRDREDYQSPSYDSRSRSRSSREERPRRYAAPPNKEIMMEGLAIDMTEEDVRSSLPTLPQPFQSLVQPFRHVLGDIMLRPMDGFNRSNSSSSSIIRSRD